MKKMLTLLMLSLIFCGCRSVEELSEAEKTLIREQQIGESMLEAFRKKDIERYLQYIPAGGRQLYGKKEFDKEQQEVASKLGEIVSYRFLTRLEMEPAHQLVWAVRFKSYSIKGEPVFKEALFAIVVGEVDESKKVFLFGFK
ncbi:MAG: hypothetical protein E7043_08070 [Lentisphaerae bacterium]|nr:hypothetical protein [Lentisphaerota bacterium]